MAGCSSSNELSAAGQRVRVVDEQPGAECQLIRMRQVSKATGFPGNAEKRAVLCAAQQKQSAQQAAAMGGNVIYGVGGPSQGMLSSFVPTDSQIMGQVMSAELM
ncbi:DUF4156 domain-containing protein [Shigella flexneri]